MFTLSWPSSQIHTKRHKKRETPSLGSAETPVQQLRLGVKLEGKNKPKTPQEL